MFKTALASLILSAPLFSLGCAAEAAPDQEEGSYTTVISNEEADAINAKYARMRCTRRPCSDNGDGTSTVTFSGDCGEETFELSCGTVCP